MNISSSYRGINARSASAWAPVRNFYETKQMSSDLKASEIANIMAEFERYTKDTPGNRWIQKNIVPVSSALGPLLDAAAMFTVAGKLGKSVNMFKPKYGKMKKYSFE
jgi:hypothetical protein